MATLGEFGKCIVCSIKSDRLEDFVCEHCGDPQKIIVNCKNCGNRLDLTENRETLEMLKKIARQKIETGTSIVSYGCPICTEMKVYLSGGIKMEIFKLSE